MDAKRNQWQRHDLSVQPDSPSEDATTAEHSSQTFFADGCEASGTLSVESPIEFDGEFEGSIVGKATVTIGPRAAVQADIKARTVIIHGAVVGNVEGTREVVLGPTAKLHGNIETPSLVIERGAFVAGQTQMHAVIPARPAPTPRETANASPSVAPTLP